MRNLTFNEMNEVSAAGVSGGSIGSISIGSGTVVVNGKTYENGYYSNPSNADAGIVISVNSTHGKAAHDQAVQLINNTFQSVEKAFASSSNSFLNSFFK